MKRWATLITVLVLVIGVLAATGTAAAKPKPPLPDADVWVASVTAACVDGHVTVTGVYAASPETQIDDVGLTLVQERLQGSPRYFPFDRYLRDAEWSVGSDAPGEPPASLSFSTSDEDFSQVFGSQKTHFWNTVLNPAGDPIIQEGTSFHIMAHVTGTSVAQRGRNMTWDDDWREYFFDCATLTERTVYEYEDWNYPDEP